MDGRGIGPMPRHGSRAEPALDHRVVIDLRDDVVIDLRGEVDVASGSAIADVVVARLDADTRPERSVVIDLEGITFFSAHGAGQLVRAQRRARERNARLVLANPSRPVLRVLLLTDLADAFETRRLIAPVGDLTGRVAPPSDARGDAGPRGRR